MAFVPKNIGFLPGVSIYSTYLQQRLFLVLFSFVFFVILCFEKQPKKLNTGEPSVLWLRYNHNGKKKRVREREAYTKKTFCMQPSDKSLPMVFKWRRPLKCYFRAERRRVLECKAGEGISVETIDAIWHSNPLRSSA